MSLKIAGLLGLWLLACSGSTYQSVEVTVSVPAVLSTRVSEYVATGVLNKEASTSGPQTFDLLMNPFTLQVAQDLRGTFQVIVNGLSTEGGVVGTGQAAVQLAGAQEYDLSITLATVKAGPVSFGPAAAYAEPEGGAASAIAAADFTGDGQTDLVTASDLPEMESDSLNLFLNQGGGTGNFKAGSSLTVPESESVFLAAGDVNGDGKPDVALSLGEQSGVYMALNQGSGTFKMAQIVGGELDSAAGLALQDLDGDTNLDLVVATGSGVQVMLGKGDGTFHPPQGFATSLNVAAVALGDLNQDGLPDVVALHQTGVLVLLGAKTGIFTVGSPPAGAGMGPGTLVIADLENQGLLDVVIARPMDMAITLLPGNGDGTFGAAQALAQGLMGGVLTVADFNSDHINDIAAVSSGTSAGGTLLLGNGDGTFTQGSFTPGPGVPVGPLQALDANGDGKPDLALIASQGEGFVLDVLLNTTP